MSIFQRLREEHRLLEREAGCLADVVAAPVPDAASVAAVRWRMARVLFSHSADEDRLVYARLLASGDIEASRIARRHRETHGAMMQCFSAYIREWPVGRIVGEWVGFQRATRAMLAQITTRVADEETEVFPHAQRIFLRDAA